MDSVHELILPNEDLPFKMFLFEGKDGSYRRARHWHRSVEFFLVQKGRLDFFIHNRKLPLQAGDFVIVNSNEIHSIDAPLPNRTVVVQIPADCFSKYLGQHDYAVFSKQSQEENRRLYQLIAEMYSTYEQKKC